MIQFHSVIISMRHIGSMKFSLDEIRLLEKIPQNTICISSFFFQSAMVNLKSRNKMNNDDKIFYIWFVYREMLLFKIFYMNCYLYIKDFYLKVQVIFYEIFCFFRYMH